MKKTKSLNSNQNSRKTFLSLSAALTGFEVLDLEGTDLAETYISKINLEIGKTHFEAFLNTWNKIYDYETDIENKIRAKLWTNELFGPIARNIIKMWYVGNWEAMPADWMAKFENQEMEKSKKHVVSEQAYREGLIWESIGTHPPGAKPPGFGSWSLPPK